MKSFKKKHKTFDNSVSLLSLQSNISSYSDITEIKKLDSYYPQGSCLSYTACSFGKKTVSLNTLKLNRFIGYDEKKLILHVESGVKISDIINWGLNNNLTLDVVPGHPDVTIGGCIAANIHGKNSLNDGTFYDVVDEITLFHEKTGKKTLSRKKNQLLFNETIGGFGITGLIISAKIKLKICNSNAFIVDRKKINMYELDFFKFKRLSKEYDHVYSMTLGDSYENSFLFLGKKIIDTKHDKKNSNLNFHIKIKLWSRVTVHLAWLIIRLIYKLNPKKIITFFSAHFPFSSNDIYHSFFGNSAFKEIQFFIKPDKIFLFYDQFRSINKIYNPTLFFISVKTFKNLNKSSLCPYGQGFIIAIDYYSIPNQKYLDSVYGMLISLDAQINLSKTYDSRLSKKLIPNYKIFLKKIKKSSFKSDVFNKIFT